MFLVGRIVFLIFISHGIIVRGYYSPDGYDLREPIISSFESILQGFISGDTTSGGFVRRKVAKVGKIFGRLKNIFTGNSDESAYDDYTPKTYGQVLNHFGSEILALQPGTHWCGNGNIAADVNDLGLFWRTDSCCRAHDQCPFSIAAGTSLGPLLNSGTFTRSLCHCDLEFFNCLKNVNTLISEKVGIMYFNILRPQCFVYMKPILRCIRYSRRKIFNPKCLEYELDPTRNATLQWIDTGDFLE